VEVRFPLLDRRLGDFVLAAPLRLGARPGPGNSKWLLRQAVAGVLPEKIRRRPDKRSSGRYIEHMMCHQVREKLSALFANTQMARYQLVDDQVLSDGFNAYCGGSSQSRTDGGFLVPMHMERWLRTHAAEQSAIRFDPLQSWQFE
jgi:hypothetical protein